MIRQLSRSSSQMPLRVVHNVVTRKQIQCRLNYCHHQGQSVVTLREMATRSRRKRRRPKPIAVTTKDRMRRLVETNLMEAQPPVLQQVSELLDVAANRLQWARDSVFRLWNPDYSSSSGANNKRNLEKSSSNGEQEERPQWQPVVMDNRWWFWNLTWALLPATLIATYCELRGRPRMEAHRRKQKLDQLIEVIGRENVPDEVLQELDAPPPPPNNPLVAALFQRVLLWLEWWQGPLPSFIDDENDVESSPSESQVRGENGESETGPLPIKPSTQSTPANTHTPAESSTLVTDVNENHNEELLRRIEVLEQIVRKQDEQRKRNVQNQLDRLRQSGIQNRAIEGLDSTAAVTPLPVSQKTNTGSDSSASIDKVWERVSQVLEDTSKFVLARINDTKGSFEDREGVAETGENSQSIVNNAKGTKEMKLESAKKPVLSEVDDEETHVNGDEKESPWWKVW